MNRRSLLSAGALATTSALSLHRQFSSTVPFRRKTKSKVVILKCASYDCAHKVVDEGLRLIEPAVKGKSVLLKPNLVEYSPNTCINTHPTVIAAAVDSLYRLGAASVVVAEGPGHVRDTEMLIEECGLKKLLKEVGRTRFVDLNFDTPSRVKTTTSLTTLRELWLPNTLLAADVVISMPKIKTHHWAGVTLSLKNLFGVVPGSVYGWPKNILHWQGIDNSIVELASTVPIHCVIADGIEAMEGNGPLHGHRRDLGCLVFSNDPVAADATCCHMMEIPPAEISHLVKAISLGNTGQSEIELIGESVSDAKQVFARRS
ncbi:MAG: DUF362 domain-containing protein [Acidobacteria bacterium]|nr:DUF362 domain-containing protein [Acidobacteriota bacterium]